MFGSIRCLRELEIIHKFGALLIEELIIVHVDLTSKPTLSYLSSAEVTQSECSVE